MNKMKLAIVGAMDSVIIYLKNKMQENGKVKEKEIHGFVFYLGRLFDKDIILVKSGVGRVASAILLTILCDHFKGIDKIINVGVAGGYGNLYVGDIVVGEKCVYGDADLTAFTKYVYGQMSNCPAYFDADKEIIDKLKENNMDCKYVCICTNETFMTEYDYAKKLIDGHFSDLNVGAFDMESAAFAQAAYVLKMPFIAIRAISDVIGDSEQVDKYKMSTDDSAKKSNIFLLKLIEIL